MLYEYTVLCEDDDRCRNCLRSSLVAVLRVVFSGIKKHRNGVLFEIVADRTGLIQIA